jgi:shikimate 5-dehydrogenase/3-dehydroquinate dehydratase
LRSRKVVQTLVQPDDPIDDRVDLIELRFDLYPDVDPGRYAQPYIATVRRTRDGGRFDGTDRRPLFARAKGAAFFDLEVDAEPIEVPAGVGIVRSVHGRRYDTDLMKGDLIKVAAKPRDVTEALDLLGVGFGIGEEFAFTRVIAPLTYCARQPIAPGMPTPEELFDLYDVRRLSLRPGLFGVVGNPVAQSESPQLHNPALRRDGLDAVYLRFLTDDLARFWPAFVDKGGLGLSVTAPLKEQAAALATDPDADVRACGAANTLLADGRAHNTDLLAFLELIPAGKGTALVMGAGGSARAAVVALQRLGYRVAIWARRPAQAAELGRMVEEPRPADVIVNTTPLPSPAGSFVVDLVYGPDERPAHVDGRTFLRAQARHQYRIFTGGDLE